MKWLYKILYIRVYNIYIYLITVNSLCISINTKCVIYSIKSNNTSICQVQLCFLFHIQIKKSKVSPFSKD